MKIDPSRAAAFLAHPGNCRVVLLHGEDEGLIRERAASLTRNIAGALDDPFRVIELPREETSRLPAEAASLSLTGGRRVVRLRDSNDSATDAVKAVLAGPGEALVILEAPGLASRSRLKTTVESAPEGAAIACYPETGRALADTIRAALAERGLTIGRDALTWLEGQLGADHGETRQELEKLALYAGAGEVDLDAAMACIGDAAGLSVDDAVFAATEGDIPLADRSIERAMAEGTTPVALLRITLMHLQRLHRARLLVSGGIAIADAAKSLRPPIFFKRLPAFTRALGLWNEKALEAALAGIAEAERACKRTGTPDVTLARHAVLTIARRAAAMRGR